MCVCDIPFDIIYIYIFLINISPLEKLNFAIWRILSLPLFLTVIDLISLNFKPK